MPNSASLTDASLTDALGSQLRCALGAAKREL